MDKSQRLALLARMFPRQRGIIGFSFGFGSDKTETTQTSQQDVELEKETLLESEKETTGLETTTALQTTELFSPEVAAQLENVLASLTSGEGASATTQLQELAALLGQQALTVEDELNATNAAILASAEAEGVKAIGQATTALSTAAGSSQNTLVQQQSLELQNDLTTQLAALDAELQKENKGVATEQFGQVLAALSAASAAGTADIGAITAIGDLLKGGTAVVTGETETATSEQEILSTIETLSEIIKSLTTGTGVSSSSSSQLGIDIGGS